MLEKEISKKDLLEIKKYFHTTIAETRHLGVADKWLINKVIDEVYKQNLGYELPKESFLAMIQTELSNYKF